MAELIQKRSISIEFNDIIEIPLILVSTLLTMGNFTSVESLIENGWDIDEITVDIAIILLTTNKVEAFKFLIENEWNKIDDIPLSTVYTLLNTHKIDELHCLYSNGYSEEIPYLMKLNINFIFSPFFGGCYDKMGSLNGIITNYKGLKFLRLTLKISIKHKNDVKNHQYHYSENDIALLCKCRYTKYGEPTIIDKESGEILILDTIMNDFMSDYYELSEDDNWILSFLTEGTLINGKDFLFKSRPFMETILKNFPERVPKIIMK